MKHNYLVIFILTSLFTFVFVQKRKCLFKDCECNDLLNREVFVECSDQAFFRNSDYFKLVRNLRVAVETGDLNLNRINLTVSLTINLVKSQKLYIQDFVFQYLNFKILHIRGNDLFDTSVVISSKAFQDVYKVGKIHFDSIQNVYMRENGNPFQYLSSFPTELVFKDVNFLKNRNFLKTLAAFQNSIKTISFISGLDFIPDLRFLTKLYLLSITQSTITNTTIYQINFDKSSFLIITKIQQMPTGLTNLTLSSIYEIINSNNFQINILSKIKNKKLSGIINQQNYNAKVNDNNAKEVPEYAVYLQNLNWELVNASDKYEEGIERSYSDYFSLNYTTVNNVTFTTTTFIFTTEYENESNLTNTALSDYTNYSTDFS